MCESTGTTKSSMSFILDNCFLHIPHLLCAFHHIFKMSVLCEGLKLTFKYSEMNFADVKINFRILFLKVQFEFRNLFTSTMF